MDADATPGARRRLRRIVRRWPAALAAVLMTLPVAPTAVAATGQTAPVSTPTAGPASPEHGFPAWYADSTGTRVEPCLDGGPLCGVLPDDPPGPGGPAPGELRDAFPYFRATAVLDLGGGAGVVLVHGLEAGHRVGSGERVTFTRTRITVHGARPDTTFTFRHPYGELTLRTDGSGGGRLVRDVAPPDGAVDPFLRWTGTAVPPGHLGDPAVPHTVVGGPERDIVEMWAGTILIAATDEFSLQGRLAPPGT